MLTFEALNTLTVYNVLLISIREPLRASMSLHLQHDETEIWKGPTIVTEPSPHPAGGC